MKRLLWVVALAGCSQPALPTPTVHAITPDHVLASESREVQVDVSAVLPFNDDFGSSAAQVDAGVQLQVGSLNARNARFGDGGVVLGTLSSQLTPGDYDVTVLLADGRQGTLAKGYHVDAGAWPTGYSIDNVPNQKNGQPFQITVHANGPNGPSFHGNVTLFVFGSSISPTLSDAFDAGTLVQTVTVTGARNNLSVIVGDNARPPNVGASNLFNVTP